MNDDRVRAEVFEHLDPTGATYLIERLECALAVQDIPAQRKNIGCEACDKYGLNLACPPHSPFIMDYIKDMHTASVICLRVPLEQFGQIVMEERYITAYRMVRALLNDELLGWRQKGHLVAGSGPCRACPECAIEKGEAECRFPDRRVFSLESMGVSVVLLTERAFGFSLEWSGNENAADFVSAIGAVFHE